jgi:hypothetical protein
MPSILEPIAAGVAVAIFNKYILSKFDPLATCYTACCHKEEEEDCTSSSSTSTINDACHVHHF